MLVTETTPRDATASWAQGYETALHDFYAGLDSVVYLNPYTPGTDAHAGYEAAVADVLRHSHSEQE